MAYFEAHSWFNILLFKDYLGSDTAGVQGTKAQELKAD